MTHRSPAAVAIPLALSLLPSCILGTEDGGAITAGTSEDGGEQSVGSTTAMPDTSDGQSSGVVAGCTVDDECPDGEVCSDGSCVPEGAPGCPLLGEPSCGNGVIEAGEECDGGDDCDPSCVGYYDGLGSTIDLRITHAAMRPDAMVAAIGDDAVTSEVVVARLESIAITGATPLGPWMSEARRIAVTDSGRTYAVGSLGLEVGTVASVVALDADGAVLWSNDELGAEVATDVFADDTMVVIGGGIEGGPALADSVLWVLDPGGAVLAQVPASAELRFLTALTKTGGELVGLGEAFSAPTRVIRWDVSGVELWSRPAAEEGEPDAVLDVIVPDGAGGTWAGGEFGEVPLLLHHDADGIEVDRIECIGGATGRIERLALSAEGRIAMGMSLYDGGVGTPWFAVLTAGAIDVGRTPHLSPGIPSSAEPGHPSAVLWSPDGSLHMGSHDVGDATSSWDIFFTP